MKQSSSGVIFSWVNKGHHYYDSLDTSEKAGYKAIRKQPLYHELQKIIIMGNFSI